LNKILKSKRGISPILATLLLIVIAVAAIVVTYAWVITFTGSTTGQAGVILSKDAVNWQTSNVTIYVRNTGISDAQIDSVYIGTNSYDNVAEQTSVTPSLPVAVSKGGGTVALTVTFTGTSHTTYYFIVAPTQGSRLQFTSECP